MKAQSLNIYTHKNSIGISTRKKPVAYILFQRGLFTYIRGILKVSGVKVHMCLSICGLERDKEKEIEGERERDIERERERKIEVY